MRVSPAQRRELVVWEYFMPKNCVWNPKTDGDIKKFFEWSEKGMHKEKVHGDMSYFNALREGKSWAGIHMQMYEDGVMDLTMPYCIILGGKDKAVKRKWYQVWKPKFTFINNPPPEEVVEFMKKEMFKGMDAEIIESAYQRVKQGK